MEGKVKILSSYKVMWVMTLFDLPVVTKDQRRRATGFRNHLLDHGFEMVQYSVYVRFTRGRDHMDSIIKRIGLAVPPRGKVDIVCFTDKQYEAIQSFRGEEDQTKPTKPMQLTIF